jgi:PAS domain S-box-containing protein
LPSGEIVAIYDDVTERKQAEEGLRESEERYKTLFDEALVGICLADAETGIIIDCNEALAALVCRERAELIGRPQKILHPPQDNKEAFSPTFKQHLTNKKGLILETQVVTRTGDIREVEIKANLLDLQGRKVLQGLFHDITESKRAEKELCESEEKFRLAFENANTGVCLVDIAGNLTKVNNSMCETFGYTKEELERMTVNDIAHPDDIDASPTFIQETLEGKIDRGTFQKRYIHKKGHVVTCQVSSSLVRDANGSPLYFISHVHDITDRKRAEEQLSSSYQQAREMLVTTVNALASTVEMKDQYTAGHQPRSTQLACAIAEEMGLPHDQIEAIRMACSIHDIGKLVVPAEILNKPGPLTDIQYEMVKMHPNAGYDIVKRIKFPWPVAEIIRQHHEYMNGSGYPQGLTGEKIMLEARVLTVANVVEAMTSHRPYRAAHDIKEALEEITKNKGILYDPGVVDACLRLFKEKGFALDALTQAANSPPGR